MKLSLNPQSPFGLREQIKRQLARMIETGRIGPGQALPPARDLAGMLGVNRNTVAAAYQDLVVEGLLRSRKGAGTFVREDVEQMDMTALDEIFDRALEQAREKGFAPARAARYMAALAQERLGSTAGRRVLVVECNQEGLDHLAGVLVRELSVEVKRALVQDLEADPAKAKELADWAEMVVCGFNHVREFKGLLPQAGREVVGVLLKPDLAILNQVLNLPAETKVGFVCINQRSTETLYTETVFASSARLVRILAGLDRPQVLKKLLAQCEVVYATNYAYNRVRELAGPDRNLVEVELTIDPANIALVREKLLQLKRR